MMFHGSDKAGLAAKIQDALNDSIGHAGLSIAIGSRRGASHTFATGYADVVAKIPTNCDHLFGIGSITKVFVAVVVLQLVEEKKLDLSDTVRQHLSSDIYHDIDCAREATIEQLLRHTAGIDSWEMEPEWIIQGRGRLMRPGHIWDKRETLNYLRRPKKFAPEPGVWYYANTNYTLLGLIIEKVTGNTAEGEIRSRILDGLGLQSTYLEGYEEPIPDRLPRRYHVISEAFHEAAGVHPNFPHIRDDLIDVTESNLSVSWLAGGMVSTSSDLVEFANALRSGKLLRPDTLTLMCDWRPTGREKDEHMGLGLFRMNIPGQGVWVGHSGGVLGFSAGLWWQEDGNCVVSVLENVGKVHAGNVRSGVNDVLFESDFLAVAQQLILP